MSSLTLPDRFHTMMQSVSDIPHLTLHRHADRVVLMTPEEQAAHLETIREFVPYPLPEDFREALPIQEGCELAWSCETAAGELRLDEFLSVIHSEPVTLDSTQWSDAMRPVLAESRVFDDQDLNGNGRMSLLRFTDEDTVEVWFYRQGELFRLNLSYSEYMARLCETRGFYDWQLFFADPKDLRVSTVLDGIDGAVTVLAGIVEALPVVFPGTDVVEYRAICQNLR